MAVDRRTHHLDGGILFEDLRNQLAHQGRVIHHQHPHRLSHDWPPAVARARIFIPALREATGAILGKRPTIRGPVLSARPRVKRSISAIMFRIKTTLPSPRIE